MIRLVLRIWDLGPYPSAGPRGTRYVKREKGKWQKGRWAENDEQIGVAGTRGRQKNGEQADWGKESRRPAREEDLGTLINAD